MIRRTPILIFIALFAAGALFLFWQNDRELDPERGKNWWTLSFASPQDPTDLSFTIENHSDQSEFRYAIVADKTTLDEGTVSLQRGETETISPSLIADPAIRTSVIITTDTGKKEIYR